MRVVPKDNLGAIDFYTVHAPVWEAEAESIGLSVTEAEAIAEAAAAARAAHQRQKELQLAARSATGDYERAMEHLRAAGSACIAKIRVAAADAGEEGGHVYALASLPLPRSASPIPPPGTPTRFNVTLDAIGLLKLTWRCKNPPGSVGTMYEIRRSDGPGGAPFAFIGLAGDKSFVDQTIPPGTPSVVYEITAVRSTRRGAPARYQVHFSTMRAAA